MSTSTGTALPLNVNAFPAAPPSTPAGEPSATAVRADGSAGAHVLGGPVPMARGDAQRSGRSPFTIPKSQPQESWRFLTQGPVVAAPALASDGTILFGSHDRHVYALSADGTLRWKYATQDMVWTAPALAADGTVYVGSDDDRVYALRLADGTRRWSASPGTCRLAVGRGPEAARCDIEQVTLGPDGTLYAVGEGVYAFAPDGSVRWQFVPFAGPNYKPRCSGGPAVAADGSIYATCQDVLVALNPDGSKRWEFQAQSEMDAGPAIAPDGSIYVGGDDRRLYAFDRAGQQRFFFLAGGALRAAPAIARDGTVYVGASDGILYALRNGAPLWSFRSGDSIHSAPLVDSEGNVLFGSRDNRLYALAADGKLLWQVIFDEDVDAPPVLGPDGTIYVGSDDQALHALR